jgi:hypothetical protein
MGPAYLAVDRRELSHKEKPDRRQIVTTTYPVLQKAMTSKTNQKKMREP